MVAGLGVVFSGVYDVAASRPHGALITWVTHTAFIHAVRLRARRVASPPPATPADVQAGLQAYVQDCEPCHGGPGVGRAAWTNGLTPPPPYLLDASQRWSPRELYWIVRHGAKMTAMPAWGEDKTDAEIWRIVDFLEASPRLSARDYARLRGASTSPSSDAPQR